MDIFNGNRKLEEAVMYSLDWGVFLRHNLEEQLMPYMYFFDGEDIRVSVLMTDGDPVEYAKRILAKENKPYQQFVIGMEGYLRDDNKERVDAIIVQGFDVTQDKGVSIAQMFEPMEMRGNFRKIDNVTYLGNPELPINQNKTITPNYDTEEIGFNTMVLKHGELKQYMAFISHSNPSLIANTIKRFLRVKFTDSDSDDFSGRFDLHINPGLINNDAFLKFLVLNAVNEERASDAGKSWEQRTGRKILYNVTHGDNKYMSEIEASNQNENTISTKLEDEKHDHHNIEETQEKDRKYRSLTVEQLNEEFSRIISIPNARTNIAALSEMADLMSEYEQRGIPLPNTRPKQTPKVQSKPWWKFW